MMFYMLHRIVSFDDNEFAIEELSKLFDDPMGLNTFLFDNMRNGCSTLQEKGLMEFQCEDGLENKEVFQIPQAVQDELLADLATKGIQSRIQIPRDELISHADIRVKKMYYNDEESEQVASLTELLGAEKFAQVQERLREKGLRSGFCCLFYGPAGTGKTETVMQIAKETGRDIFIVDMSKLKSKWIGDSEKNIKKLFRTYKALAKESTLAPILLFNEADAIFGKRINEETSADKSFNAIQNIILQGQSHDGQIVAPQTQDGDTDEEAQHTGNKTAADHGQQQPHSRNGNHGLQHSRDDDAGEGTDAHKARMAQAQLTADAHQQIQGNRQGNVRADGDQIALHGAAQRAGAVQSLHHTVGSDHDQIGHVIPVDLFQHILHNAPHTFSWICLPSRPAGLTSRMMIRTENTMASENWVEI